MVKAKVKAMIKAMIKATLLTLGLVSSVTNPSHAAPVQYQTLAQDNAQLREQFNADHGKVRLLFIVGPSCGVCLRGMADLNEAFIAASQNNPQLETYVVHVPALGAETSHVEAAIPLLNGPRVTHYWQAEGTIGLDFQDTLKIEQYAWDVWLIYGPEASWQDDAPPPPDFWQHQLSRLLSTHDNYLDADQFRTETLRYLDQLAQLKSAQTE